MAKRLPANPPVLAGYTYARPLGVGGFADVFLFEQNLPRRSVAVKVLLQDIVDADLLRMFNVEADVMARLSAHPSILTVYDASISSDGRPFLVMELCPTSMGNRYRSETISVAEVLNIGVKIASALETAHRAGLLHRDIKPSNILITTFGSPVLADFGISSSIAGSSKSDVIAMSVPWSAPEVVEERISGSVASEVWALGSTLYTLLAGRTPFEVDGSGKNSREQLSSRISRARYTPITRNDIPPRLQQALSRSMSKDPSVRQASMLEFATELQYVQYELGLMPTPLEVASEGWDTAGAPPVNFDNTASRGPVQSTVATESKRAQGVKRSATTRARDDDEAIFSQAANRPAKKVSLAALIWVGVGVVVLATAAIVAAIIIGGI